jgi:hypothetical protein
MMQQVDLERSAWRSGYETSLSEWLFPWNSGKTQYQRKGAPQWIYFGVPQHLFF